MTCPVSTGKEKLKKMSGTFVQFDRFGSELYDCTFHTIKVYAYSKRARIENYLFDSRYIWVICKCYSYTLHYVSYYFPLLVPVWKIQDK